MISGLRHRLVHDYDGTNWSIISDVVFEELPELITRNAKADLIIFKNTLYQNQPRNPFPGCIHISPYINKKCVPGQPVYALPNLSSADNDYLLLTGSRRNLNCLSIALYKCRKTCYSKTAAQRYHHRKLSSYLFPNLHNPTCPFIFVCLYGNEYVGGVGIMTCTQYNIFSVDIQVFAFQIHHSALVHINFLEKYQEL